jgi:hypothetical protein
MAKSGRYSADRKKIEVISGNKTIEVADCGTIFTIGSASATLTLPTMAAAGKGWWCRFVVNDESQAVTINKAAADTANQMVGNVITGGDNGAMQLQPTTPGTAFDAIAFTTSVIQGDFVEISTDGLLWFVTGNSAVTDAITCS